MTSTAASVLAGVDLRDGVWHIEPFAGARFALCGVPFATDHPTIPGEECTPEESCQRCLDLERRGQR